jgi:PadR family transcriptional regulator, regulatory protein PadR
MGGGQGLDAYSLPRSSQIREGLVKKGQHDRRTNFYTLTDKGRHEVEAYCKWEAQYVTFNI